MKVIIHAEADYAMQLLPLTDALAKLVGDCVLDQVSLQAEVEGDGVTEIRVTIQPKRERHIIAPAAPRAAGSQE